jgi:starch synthase
MRIAFVTSEAFPFVKTGGLADVSYSLPRALARRGHDVRIIMPRYYRVDKGLYGLRQVGAPLGVPLGSGEKWGAVYESRHIPGVPAVFIEHDDYFGRDRLTMTAIRPISTTPSASFFFHARSCSA